MKLTLPDQSLKPSPDHPGYGNAYYRQTCAKLKTMDGYPAIALLLNAVEVSVDTA